MKKTFIRIHDACAGSLYCCRKCDGSQSEIEQNKEKWENANISTIAITYPLPVSVSLARICLMIEVQDGEVVSMEYQSGNEIDATSRELFEKYATIDRIFSELEADSQRRSG